MTAEEKANLPSKWTREELLALEKTLKDHERWLHEWVEKQKSVKINEDPVITTTEMKARAKTLELHLQKLVRRKVPKPRKSSSSSDAAQATNATNATATTDGPVPDPSATPGTEEPEGSAKGHDEL